MADYFGRKGKEEHNKIIFAHIPKTAGTSFRKAVEDSYPKSKIYEDYGIKAQATSKEIRQAYSAGFDDFLNKLNLEKSYFLTSHFHDTSLGLKGYLRLVEDANVIVFFRDPIDRLLSEFYHFRDKNGYKGTFANFIRAKDFINRQSFSISNVPLDTFSFVGITEKYSECVGAFNKMFGLDIKVKIDNSKPGDSPEEKMTDKDMEFFCQSNVEDIMLYNMAVVHSFRLIREPIPVLAKDRFSGEVEIINNCVRGWCCDYMNYKPVNVIFYNSNFFLRKRASKFDKKIKKSKKHITGYAGFSVDLESLKRLGGREKIHVAIEDGPVIGCL